MQDAQAWVAGQAVSSPKEGVLPMTTLAITYDLNAPGKDYGPLLRRIAALPNAFRYQKSAWLVRGNWSATAVRDHLLPMIDGNDEVMVLEVTTAAWKAAVVKQASIQLAFLRMAA